MITPQPAPTRVPLTAGLVAFVALMVAPAVIASAVVLGAWLVSDEVYAAERAAASGDTSAASVAEWKTALVGVCPIH